MKNPRLRAAAPQHVPIQWEDEQPPVPGGSELPLRVEIPLRSLSAALAEGAQGMIREGQERYGAWQKGELDTGSYAVRILERGARDAARGGVRTALAIGLNQGLRRYVLRHWGRGALMRLSRHNALSAFAFGAVDQGFHTAQWLKGSIPLQEYQIRTVENAGSTGGAIGGTAAGAVLGSVIPGLGTAGGALLGLFFSMVGSMAGADAGRSLGKQWFGQDEAAQP
jgi:hypothetical protein